MSEDDKTLVDALIVHLQNQHMTTLTLLNAILDPESFKEDTTEDTEEPTDPQKRTMWDSIKEHEPNVMSPVDPNYGKNESVDCANDILG